MTDEEDDIYDTAFAAAINKKASPTGTVQLLHRMATDNGISAKIMSETKDDNAHVWNQLIIDGTTGDVDLATAVLSIDNDLFEAIKLKDVMESFKPIL